MTPPATFLSEVISRDGRVETTRFVHKLGITKIQLATASGLSRDAVSKSSRLNARATQTRLREVVEILNQVLPWAGSLPQAFAWYRSQPVPSFGGRTPEDLVKEGRAEALKAYLARIRVGGYA